MFAGHETKPPTFFIGLHQLHLQQSPVGLSLLNTLCGAFVGMVKNINLSEWMVSDPKDAKNSGFGDSPGLDEAEIATSAPLLIGDWVRVVVRLIVSSGVIKHAGPLGNE